MTSEEFKRLLRLYEIKLRGVYDNSGARDWMRAAVYWQEILDAEEYFTSLAKTYDYAKKALVNGVNDLLNQLAQSLDFFAAPAFAVPLSTQQNVSSYFDEYIFNKSETIFTENVNKFRNACPIVDAAIKQIAQNFKNNITTMCKRVYEDRKDIARLFEGDNNKIILEQLLKIQSTGSDFHKGGQQVLILTFRMVIYKGTANTMQKGTLKVVYKPGDLEADCLIVGDSRSVNKVIPNFMTKSLFELFNDAIPYYEGDKPDSKAELRPLSTYKILPRNYLSKYNPLPYPVPVREAYGYAEYLAYNPVSKEYIPNPGLLPGIYADFKFGCDDFLIWPERKNREKIIETFYIQMGHFIAIASTFSITDMHFENVRVHQYTLHPIDLELSLTRENAGVYANRQGLNPYDTTGLFGDHGGITGEVVIGELAGYIFDEKSAPPIVTGFHPPKRRENRLYEQTTNSTRECIAPDQTLLIKGLISAMLLLRWMQEKKSFHKWFQRLMRVLVRVMPYPTADWNDVRANIFRFTVSDSNSYGSKLSTTVAEVLTTVYNNALISYGESPTDLPNFLVYNEAQARSDLMNLDIPTYYHVIGTKQIVGSNGQQITVPEQVQRPNGSFIKIGRDTYYPNFPTFAAVYNAQVKALLKDPDFTNHVHELINGLKHYVKKNEPNSTDLVL